MKFNLSQPQRLKAVFVATVLGAAAIEGTVLAQKHHVHTGKDAFLHYQVDSTNELIQALKENPTLRKNYAHHFGIPEDQVVDFVKRTLVPYHLTEGREVTTYGVTKAGRIYPVHEYLRKGTLVWATRSGLPVLKWACANPLTKNLPGTLLSMKPKSTGNVAPRHLPKLAAVTSPILPVPPTGPAGEVTAPELTAPQATETSALTVPPVLTGTSSSIVPAIAAVPIPVSGSGGRGSSLLPLIPILVGISTLGHGGHGGNTSSGEPPVIVDVPTPAPSTPVSVSTPGGPTSVSTPTSGVPSGLIPVSTPGAPSASIPTSGTPSGSIPVSGVPSASNPVSGAPSGSIPTPSQSAPVAGSTPAPNAPIVVSVPTPGAPSGVPSPAPGAPGMIPTPAPTAPPVIPTPPAYVPPTGTPTPAPSVPVSQPNTPSLPNPPSAVPEPGSFALALLAGVPIVGGFAARRRRK